MSQGSGLRVIPGAFARPHTINGVEIHLYAEDRRLPDVQALLVEQDTALLLEQQLELNQAENSRPLSHATLESDYEYPLGTILPKQGQPLRLHAVIHNLEECPNWSTQGVETALDNLFSLLSAMSIESIAMPPLAHRHGEAPISFFLSLLCNYLERRPPPWSGKLWLLLPQHALKPSLSKLRCRYNPRKA